jgi:acetylornithine aminotransferase
MSDLAEMWPGAEVRGRGLLVAVEFSSDVATEIVERALGAGLVLNATSPNTLRFAPPLVITNEQLDDALATLEEVADAVLTKT